jgi:hypothetical protein
MKKKLARIRRFRVFVVIMFLANTCIRPLRSSLVWTVPPKTLVFKYPVRKEKNYLEYLSQATASTKKLEVKVISRQPLTRFTLVMQWGSVVMRPHAKMRAGHVIRQPIEMY